MSCRCHHNTARLVLSLLNRAYSGSGLYTNASCLIDVVKTRTQTEVRVEPAAVSTTSRSTPQTSSTPHHPSRQQIRHTHSQALQPLTIARCISTSSPTTTPAQTAAMKLNTDSIWEGLKMIFRHEGVQGLFRGVMPRAVWTSIQSGKCLINSSSCLF